MTLPVEQSVFSVPGSDVGVALGCMANRKKDSSVVRVLHVINGEHYSGAERVQDLLSARLPECGFEVGFVCVKPGKFVAARTYQAAPVFETPMQSRFDWQVVRQVSKIVHEGRYALVHAHTPRSALIARPVAALTGLPMVYHVHSPTSRDTTHRLRNVVNHWIERVSLHRIAALVTVSDSLNRHMVAQGFSKRHVFTVPNGVPRAAIQRSPDCPAGTWTLGMTALFRPRKGLEILLHSLALLQRANLPVRLRAVGPFETVTYEREIHDLAKSLGVESLVDWIGFTTNVAAELTRMDLFVLPSLFGEGLPMVVLEAMAAGVPIVATRVEGIPEAIEHGISGCIAEPNDPESLAKSLRDVILGEYSWSGLRQCALLRHANQFSDSLMAQRLAAIYQQILAAKH